MIITDRLKQLIFKHLYKELGNAEIIPYNGSVWFIDRENSYWYFQLSKQGCLYWRYSFFPSFFSIFSLEQSEFEPILSSWVEEVLNYKVSTTQRHARNFFESVEEVLNSKVSTTLSVHTFPFASVEEVLNSKVSTTSCVQSENQTEVEEVLNSKVFTTNSCTFTSDQLLEEILNHKVSETFEINASQKRTVKKVLDSRVSTTGMTRSFSKDKVEEVLNSTWVKKALNNVQQNESNR